MRFAWLLILVYVPMMLATTFHHHSEAEGADASYYCYDCAHHIHHDGHFTSSHAFAYDCVLCHLHSLPYVVPVIVKIAVFAAVIHAALVLSCPVVKTREGRIHLSRAPPVFSSL